MLAFAFGHCTTALPAALDVLLHGQDDGYVAKILVQAGAHDIKVNTPLALLVEEEKDIGAFADYEPEASSSGTSEQPKGTKLW